MEPDQPLLLLAQDGPDVMETAVGHLLDQGFRIEEVPLAGETVSLHPEREAEASAIVVALRQRTNDELFQLVSRVREQTKLPITVLIDRMGDEALRQMASFPSCLVIPRHQSAMALAAIIRLGMRQHGDFQQQAVSEKKYRYIFENAPIGIVRTTLSGQLLDGNLRMAEMVGCASVEEALRIYADVPRTFYTSMEDRSRLIQMLQEGRSACHLEHLARRKDGTLFWASTHAVLDQETKTIYGFIVDITDRKEAEFRRQQLVQAGRMASLGVLSAGVAHEINNPNHLVQGYAELATDMFRQLRPALEEMLAREEATFNGLPADQVVTTFEEMLKEIRNASRRIGRIVSQLKDYTRDLPMEQLEEVNVHDLLESVQVLMASTLKKATYHYTTRCPADLPRLVAHRQRLEQVLINLLQYACRSLSGPEKAVRLEIEHVVERGLFQFRVAMEGVDFGPDPLGGPAACPLPHQDIGGAGLGLFFASAIIKEHGGNLRFGPVPGWGAMATVELPVHWPR